MKKVIFGQVGRLRPEKIDEYCKLHAEPWPEVLKTITDCNLRNYSIFRHNDLVFSYFEYVGDDYDADMKKMEADPVTQKWWATQNHVLKSTQLVRSANFITIWNLFFIMNKEEDNYGIR